MANQEIFASFSVDTHTSPWLGAPKACSFPKKIPNFRVEKSFSTRGCGVCFLHPVKWWRPWLRRGTLKLQDQWCDRWRGNPGKHDGTRDSFRPVIEVEMTLYHIFLQFFFHWNFFPSLSGFSVDYDILSHQFHLSFPKRLAIGLVHLDSEPDEAVVTGGGLTLWRWAEQTVRRGAGRGGGVDGGRHLSLIGRKLKNLREIVRKSEWQWFLIEDDRKMLLDGQHFGFTTSSHIIHHPA